MYPHENPLPPQTPPNPLAQHEPFPTPHFPSTTSLYPTNPSPPPFLPLLQPSSILYIHIYIFFVFIYVSGPCLLSMPTFKTSEKRAGHTVHHDTGHPIKHFLSHSHNRKVGFRPLGSCSYTQRRLPSISASQSRGKQ